MTFKTWKKKVQEKQQIAQVRMISTGNQLIGRTEYSAPQYGIYLVEKDNEDPLAIERNAGIYSAIGGGATIQAPVEFFVRKAPLKGFFVKRRHNYDYETDTIVGYSLSLVGADGVAYRTACKTARGLSPTVQDRTSEDLAQFADCSSLKLEDRIYNWNDRVKQHQE